MSLRNPEAYASSKYYDKKIVDHYIAEFGNSAISTDDDDTKRKFDIIIGEKKIDTKYFSKYYYEVDKHAHSQATHLWYIMQNTDWHKTFLIKKDALARLCDDITGDPNVDFKIGKSNQRLAEFSISQLDPSDYEVIDLSELK